MNKQIWLELTSIKQLDEIIASSQEKLAAIFKDSTRCGISRMVLNQFEKQITSKENINFYYLDLLNHRVISNEIANRFDILHQSPQLILLQDTKVVSHSSHNQILDVDLLEFLK